MTMPRKMRRLLGAASFRFDRIISKLLPLAVSLGALAWPSLLAAQVSLVEISDASGLGQGYEVPQAGFGSGAALGDFDADGFVDVFVPTSGGVGHQLYRNLGNGQFEEVAAEAGVASLERGRAGLWLDYDGDHRLDLLVHNDCYQGTCAAGSFLQLFRQTSTGVFEERTVEAGLFDNSHDEEQHSSGMAAADVNHDGFLDFVAGFWEGALRLYLNQGDGTFSDVSSAVGLDNAVLGYHQPVMQDFNGDGLVDIYAAVDFTENRLWLHQGTSRGMPSFVESAGASGCDNAMNDMGVALGDFDDDGLIDLYVTNIFRDGRHNILLHNQLENGSLSFSETSQSLGVDEGGWGWGTTFLDVDNDGDLDLAETNGWRTNTWESPPRFFIHQGGQPASFVDQAAAMGLTDASWGSSLLAFDFDRDGDLDLLETVPEVVGAPNQEEVRLYENQLHGPTPRVQAGGKTAGGKTAGGETAVGGAASRYLVVKPRMAGANHLSIGAKISADLGEKILWRWIGAGGSYLGQEPAEAFFGLGTSDSAERVEIHWPDGKRTKLLDIAADQMLTVTDDLLFSSGFERGDLSAWSEASP